MQSMYKTKDRNIYIFSLNSDSLPCEMKKQKIEQKKFLNMFIILNFLALIFCIHKIKRVEILKKIVFLHPIFYKNLIHIFAEMETKQMLLLMNLSTSMTIQMILLPILMLLVTKMLMIGGSTHLLVQAGHRYSLWNSHSFICG